MPHARVVAIRQITEEELLFFTQKVPRLRAEESCHLIVQQIRCNKLLKCIRIHDQICLLRQNRSGERMHKRLFCQNLLDNALTNTIHAKRKGCLVRFLSDLMDYDTKLSVTEIGKKLSSKSTVKSKIYAAQTLVNNYKLSQQISVIYKGWPIFSGECDRDCRFNRLDWGM